MHDTLNEIRSQVIGRRVTCAWRRTSGVVLKYRPLSPSMTDALIQSDDGSRCWFSLHECKPADGMGPLPSRRYVQMIAQAETAAQLQEILETFLRDEVQGNRRWFCCEHGKRTVGAALIRAIRESGATPTYQGVEIVDKMSWGRVQEKRKVSASVLDKASKPC